MDGVYAPEIDNCYVANLGNSPAITCDSRLAFVDFRHISAHPELIKGSLVFKNRSEQRVMKVSKILKDKGTDCFSIGPDQLLYEAVELMTQHKIGSLLVMENGNLKSIVTERDVMGAVGKYKDKIIGIKVEEVMAPSLVTCCSDDDIASAMDQMTNNVTKRWIRHLPVVDEGKLSGMISIGDIVHALLKEAKFENRLLKNYIQNWPDEDADGD